MTDNSIHNCKTSKPILVIDDAIPYLRGRLEKDFDCVYKPGETISKEDLKNAQGLLVRTRTKCNAKLIEGSDIEFVATGTIGIDHIDTEWCTFAGIEWQNAPGCNAPAVAQYVWSILLRLGFNPQNRTRKPVLGIVGKGNVGGIVAEWGRRLGAEILVCDPFRKEMKMEDENYLSIEELATRVDAITFHTPLTTSGKYPSYHLADKDILSHLRSGCIIVNAARGGVIDEKALGAIAPAKGFRVAIDTWEEEPHISEATLNITDIATPHIAGYSRQGKERATMAILNSLEKHFKVNLPKERLAGPYLPPEVLSCQLIMESFDPSELDTALREHPEDFETQRDSYVFRNEFGADHFRPEYKQINIL